MSRNENTFISVKAVAGASKESIRLKDGTWHVSVKEKAENDQANRRIRVLLARELSLPEKAIRLILGRRSPSKKFILAAGGHTQTMRYK